MVNIKFRFILTILLAFILVSSIVFAAGNRLEIKKIDAKVGSKTDKDLKDGDTISRDAEPDNSLEIKVKVENNFTSSEDLDIEDITVTVTVEGIDDGDDLEEESQEFDLKQGKTKTVTLNFKIPLIVDEDSYSIVIEAEGTDENGTDHSKTANIDLEVDKDDDQIIFRSVSVTPSNVKCSRTVTLSADLLNIGSDDQDEVVYETKSPDLGIDIRQANIEMSEDIDEDENEFRRSDTIQIPKTVAAGSYPIVLTAYYDTDKRADSKTLNLLVEDCPVTQATQQQATQTQPQVTQPTTAAVTKPAEQVYPVVQEETSLFDNTTFLILAGLAYLVVIGIGIVLVMKAIGKK